MKDAVRQLGWLCCCRAALTNRVHVLLPCRHMLQSPLLVLALVSLILARSIDQTIFYRLAQVYTNYVWYLGAVILPIAFLFISWPVVWWKMIFTGTGGVVSSGVASLARDERVPRLFRC